MRSRGSGIRGSLSSTEENVVYMKTSKKISGRYFLLDRNDVVRLLRWDLMKLDGCGLAGRCLSRLM